MKETPATSSPPANGEAAVLEAIRHSPLGFQADQRVIAALAPLAQLKSYPPGTEIFREGDRHSRLYIVCGGSVSLHMTTATCGQRAILTAGLGDVIAWSALLADESMTATAVVVEPTQLLVFDAPKLAAACDADHELGYVVMKWMARAITGRLLATRLQLLDMYHT